MKPIIQIRNGIPRHPLYRMTEPVNLSINEGEQIAIVGPNGSGKSLLIDIMIGRWPLLMNEVEYNFSHSESSLACENIRYITFRDSYGDSDTNLYYQQRWNSQDMEITPVVKDLLPRCHDTELEGKNIFNVLPSEVNVRQSQQISNSMKAHVAGNSKRELSGYRVRIFFDNKQSARGESEATLNRFRSLYPEIRAYRIYTNPYFKVTVGDFRTKSEAMALLARIKGAFPSAFVVKENIGYPIVDKDNAVVSDTIKVLRPVGK